jgi:hypothetical protein
MCFPCDAYAHQKQKGKKTATKNIAVSINKELHFLLIEPVSRNRIRIKVVSDVSE